MTEKHSEKSRNIVKNVFYGFSTWILPLVLSFVATPVIVRSLDHQDYGIYALVLSFIAYSFNFNLGRAVTKYIAEYRLRNETQKIREIVSASLWINLAIGLFGLAVIWLSAKWLVADVFFIEENAREKTVTALHLSALIIFFTMLNQVFSSILQGIHRFDVYSKILNSINISLLLGNLILVLVGYGLLALLSWNLAATAISSFIYYRSAKILLPETGLSFKFSTETLKLVLNFSWGVVGYQILANIFLLFERSWLMRKFGAENLTFYVVPMMLALYLHSFIGSLTMVVFPLASELASDREKLLRLYTKATKIVCLLVVFPALTLIVENQTFLTLWMGSEFGEKSSGLLILHAVTFGLLAIYIIPFQMAEGLGFPEFNFFMMGVGLTIGLSLMFILTDSLGSFGVAWARLAAYGAIFLSAFYLEKRFFKAIQIKFWLRTAALLAFAGILAAAGEKTIVNALPLNWLTFLLAVLGGGLIYTGVLWLTGYFTADEKEFFRRMRVK